MKHGHKQWQFENRGEYGPENIDIDVNEAWKITTGGKTVINHDIVVVVLDRGVLLSHPDLKDNIWVNPFEIDGNGIDDDGNGYVDDINGWNFRDNTNDVGLNGRGHIHGTPINGIIGANGLNTIGVTGINKSVKLLNIVRGPDTASVFKAYRYISSLRREFNDSGGKRGALVVAVNHSWGIDSVFAAKDDPWCLLLDEMGELGIISSVSVPNDNIDIDQYGDLPSSCSSNSIISVTNTNHFDDKVYHAGYGELLVDIGAPGDYSFTTLNDGDYGYFQGTSAAAPYITGTVALMYSLPSLNLGEVLMSNPKLLSSFIKESIVKSAVKSNGLSTLTASSGRLNVAEAMRYLCLKLEEPELYQRLQTDHLVHAIYPNPVEDLTTLLIEAASTETISLKLYTLNGSKIYSVTKTIEKGLHPIILDLANYESGTYLLRLETSNLYEIKKIKKL